MSELLMVVKPKHVLPPAPIDGDIVVITRTKAVAPVVKDDDDDMTDAITMPLCPKCSKSDDVMSIDAHPHMGGSDYADGTDTLPASDSDDDDDSPDGYCCTTCAYVWPGDSSTPQETPARPKTGRFNKSRMLKSLIDGGMGEIKAKEMAEAAEKCDRVSWTCQSFVSLLCGRDKTGAAVNAASEFIALSNLCGALLSKGSDDAISQCSLTAAAGRKAVSAIQAILPLLAGDADANDVASRAILAISAAADCCEECQPDAEPAK